MGLILECCTCLCNILSVGLWFLFIFCIHTLNMYFTFCTFNILWQRCWVLCSAWWLLGFGLCWVSRCNLFYNMYNICILYRSGAWSQTVKSSWYSTILTSCTAITWAAVVTTSLWPTAAPPSSCVTTNSAPRDPSPTPSPPPPPPWPSSWSPAPGDGQQDRLDF